VDDGPIISKTAATLDYIYNKIGEQFEVTSTPLTKFVGMQVECQADRAISILQSTSIQDLLEKFNKADSKPNTVPMQDTTDLRLV